MIPYALQPIDTIKESCFDLYKHSSNVKPDYWQ
jgi:hypothetical protein